ncbi:DNA repair protein RAD5 [Nannizzia gypsea CBS 118893]|uniref:DNA repair protein RAD5 n=1 Tax=Arthroderma gypseum (strain ATCC MYA-4604 / CBS 118893) TaxID=535722 RepID=E4URB8_ARTGP|nr:DNA repair protein RAD5 [Nannizzia gypsea CBS 118893]EFR00181.1 DNA repair protein RAD5 [Nannizzia gypsea CBS 118893]
MDFNAQVNNSHTEDVALDEDLMNLAPLLQPDTSFTAREDEIMRENFMLPSPLNVMDTEAQTFTQGPENCIPKYSDSENDEEAKIRQNYSAATPVSEVSDTMWIKIEKDLDNSELDGDSDKIFQEAKAAFEAEKNPSLESQIRFDKLQEKERMRLSRAQLRKASIKQENSIRPGCIDGNETEAVEISKVQGDMVQNPDQGENFELFCADNNESPVQGLCDYPSPDNQELLPASIWERTQKPKEPVKPKGRCRQNGTSKQGKKATNDKVKKTKEKRNNARGRKSNGPSKSKKGCKNRESTTFNLDSLFTCNIVESAKRNVNKNAIPGFSAGDKRKAMRELMASIPTDEEIDTESMSEHKKAIMDSIMKFTKRPRADKAGGWRHKDMTTSLFHYQRDRENSSAAPKGGFLCDEMGFGKTIQAIANMVDGSATLDSKEPKTTLIVTPTHLIEHWKDELLKHVKSSALGIIVVYHGAQKQDLRLIIQSAGQQNIGAIITTYSEIRASCHFPVPDFTSKEDENKWKSDNCCFLHNFKFRRIYLDEAHEIKNHKSKTSEAVRLLVAKFRWVITGTPIHNYITEFYSYFDFLKVPGLENYYLFLAKIVKNDPDHRKLINCLRAFMLRRTHEATLFGLPILKLPGIDENTVVVKFSIIEKALYKKIIGNFLDKHLHTMRTVEGVSNYLTLLMYLRMFTSHLLLPDKVINQILTRQFMQEIQPEIIQSSNAEDMEMYNSLQTARFEDPTGPLHVQAETQSDTRISSLFESLVSGSEGNKSVMDCCACKQRQTSGLIMSCMHLCCFDCQPSLPQVGHEQITCRCGSTVNYEICLDLQRLYHSKPIPIVKGPKTRHFNVPREDERAHIINTNYNIPSAKLRAVKTFVSRWLKESPGTKITIFTQFIGMISALCTLCDVEGWGYTTLCGKIHHRTRHSNIKRFREDKNTSILISSLKTGGVGLNLTMANKCILVDLWWNEAIEQQAFCRLFRIGQEKDVEIVRICVENTVDDRLQLIQSVKTKHIKQAMGPAVLAQRRVIDNLADILKLFGAEEDENTDKGYRFLSDEEMATQLNEKEKTPDADAN